MLAACDFPPAFAASTPARLQGLVFAPTSSLDDAWVAAARARGVDAGEPERFGGEVPFFTDVLFGGLVDDPRTIVYACEYHVRQMNDLDARRSALKNVGGGRLGVRRVAEIVIGTRTPKAAAARWQRLLDPLLPAGPGRWTFVNGPSLRLVEAANETIHALVLEVASIERARLALTPSGVATLGGLDLRFVEP